MPTALEVFRMPKSVSVMGRSSSLTNSFVNGIVPTRFPTEEEVAEALAILGLQPGDLRCAYCGDRATEWDHFRPLVDRQEPTGYISEIENLVPACGKCNQSKGNSDWRSWMLGTAKLCPRSRNISDLHERIERLARFEQWRSPTKLEIADLVGEELWAEYRANWRRLLDSLKESQRLAHEVRVKLHGVVELKPSAVFAPSGRRRYATSHREPITSEEIAVLVGRIRSWASRPELNVHKIIAIIANAGGSINHHMFVAAAIQRLGGRTVRGAIASLMTNRGNSYGRVLTRNGDVTMIHPELESEVRAHTWSDA
jgi:hypothetical protein